MSFLGAWIFSEEGGKAAQNNRIITHTCIRVLIEATYKRKFQETEF